MIFTILQIVFGLIVICLVVLQNRGTDAGITFGSGSSSYRSKRGLEKFLFYGTIFFVAVFAAISILSVLI